MLLDSRGGGARRGAAEQRSWMDMAPNGPDGKEFKFMIQFHVSPKLLETNW